MAKLPTQRTRLPGVDRFDIELNAFLRSCGFILFFSNHEFPNGLWMLRDGAQSPEVVRPAFRAALRLALIDPDTSTEPTRQKVKDGLAALASRNLHEPSVVQRMAAYQSAREAEYEARHRTTPEPI